MSYTALYRKFRPDSFSEVKGQEHIVATLKNQIKADRIGHAYLFCGTRGTGKTTVAKILAKAVNCENLVDGSPCNECETCKAIAAGASMNVIEIDAASNNGVDNIREIRDEVQYPPTQGRFKVYIIDEVHMLSIGAFNALLKTLEEPPAYVIFILATTEAHKIPVTILSRCQRYDFKRIGIDVISDRIKELAQRENIEIEDRAVKYIAKAADGALRDALSLMDQCIAFYLGERLTYDNVLEVLGAVDTTVFSQMLRAIMSGDTIVSMKKLDEVIMSGRDLGQFIVDFTWYLRNLLLVKTSGEDATDIVDVTTERMNSLKEEAQETDVDMLMRYIRILSELSNQLKYSTSRRVLAEVALVKMTKPAMEADYSAIINRLNQLEKKIESGDIVAKPVENMVKQPEEKPEPKNVSKLSVAVPEDIKEIADNWDIILREFPGGVRNMLKTAKVSYKGDNKLYIVVSDGIMVSGLIKNHTEEIKDTIAKVTQKLVEVEIVLLESGQNYEDHFLEITTKINIPIGMEDF